MLPAALGAQTPVPAAPPVVARGAETFDSAWSIIHRRHFDTTFGGVDWVALRDTLRPRAAAARSTEELREVIRSMVGRLKLSHYALLAGESAGALTAPERATAPTVPGTIGLELRIAGGAAVVSRVDAGGPADQAGIRAGWLVTRVDTVDVGRIAATRPSELAPHQAAFHAAASANALLGGSAGAPVALVLRDARDRVVRRTLVRAPRAGLPVTLGHLPTLYVRSESWRAPLADGRSAGVIRFNVWMPAVLPAIDAAVDTLRDADGLVFDLRGNPGGVAAMVMGTAGHLVDSVVTLGVMTSRDGTLRYVSNPRRVNRRGERVVPYRGPVAVIVDEMSASTSEFFAAGLQAIGRARVFGARTAGQALPAQLTRLPNGDVLYHAVADFTTPTGARLEKLGVVPDEPVPLRRADLLVGRDAALEAALRWIAAQPR